MNRVKSQNQRLDSWFKKAWVKLVLAIGGYVIILYTVSLMVEKLRF